MGLPLKSAGTAALLPDAIAKLSEDLELSQRDVMIFVAAREAAYQRPVEACSLVGARAWWVLCRINGKRHCGGLLECGVGGQRNEP